MPLGSWYSQFPAFGWFDPEDRPGSAAYRVGGRSIPDSQQGIALPTRGGLGKWYNVTPPGSDRPFPLQQTDIGPAPYTGRGVDISAAGAHQMGYTPKNFPTDANFKVEPIDLTGLGLAAGWGGGVPGDNQTAVAEGPRGGARKMPESLMDMFQPRSVVDNQPIGIGDALAQNRNALVGFGMGMLQPRSLAVGAPVGSAMTDALGGYMQGARADSANTYRQAALAHTKRQDAFRAAEAMRAQYNTDRSFKEGQRQFDVGRELKPSIHWTADKTDEKGDVIPGKPYYVDPANQIIREMRPEDALKVPLPQTGAVPGAQVAPEQQTGAADETAIPPAATTVQAAPADLPLNRRKAIDAYSKETGENIAKTNEKQQAGTRVMGLIDRLISKTQHPDDPSKDNPLFAEAAGPTHEYASNQPVWNPARLAYEYTPLGPSKEAQGFLGQIRSDAQAINSELQRAYLSGQGSVTENERAQISDILGRVAAARSPQEARGLLNNAKEIIAIAMQKGYATPGAAEGAKPAPQTPAPKTSSEPDPRAVKFLRAYPNRAQEFDAKYGPGSAARYLNEM